MLVWHSGWMMGDVGWWNSHRGGWWCWKYVNMYICVCVCNCKCICMCICICSTSSATSVTASTAGYGVGGDHTMGGALRAGSREYIYIYTQNMVTPQDLLEGGGVHTLHTYVYYTTIWSKSSSSQVLAGNFDRKSARTQNSIPLSFEWYTGWWFEIFFIFIPIWGFMIQFDEHIFQMGWFNHQLVYFFLLNRLIHHFQPTTNGSFWNRQVWQVKRSKSRERVTGVVGVPRVVSGKVWGVASNVFFFLIFPTQTTGIISHYLFWEDQTWCKCMVIFRDLPYNSALFGLVV